MTNAEAKAILKSNKPTSDPRKCGRELCSAVDIAIKALEKQIPKKPIKSDTEIRYCEVWKCPSCGFEWSSRVVDFCYKCGQAIDWSEVEVDTPILVREYEDGVWIRRYFAKYSNGKVYAWSDGKTSWTTSATSAWKCAKLVESEEK